MDNSRASHEFLDLIIKIFPGFVSVMIMEFSSKLIQISDFRYILYAFILSVINYFLASSCYKCYRLILRYKSSPSLPFLYEKDVGNLSDRNRTYITIAIIISVITGWSGGYAIDQDVFYRIPFIDMVINKKSGKRTLVYLLYNNTKKRFQNEEFDSRPDPKVRDPFAPVSVQLKNGAKYEGFPILYETGNRQMEIYLSPACYWQEYTLEKHDGPGIIVFEKEIENISFVDLNNSKCYQLWYPTKTITISELPL